MSQLYLYIFKSLFGLLQRTQGIYLAAKQWHWNSAEGYIVLCWWSAATAIQKMIWWRLPMYAHLITFISFSHDKYKSHGCWQFNAAKWLLTVLKLILQQCPIVLPLLRKGLLWEYTQCKWRLCSINAGESLFQLYPCNYIYKLQCVCVCGLVHVCDMPRCVSRKLLKEKRWENWNDIQCNQIGDKLRALISTLTDALLLTRTAISHSSTETERCDCKACGSGSSAEQISPPHRHRHQLQILFIPP